MTTKDRSKLKPPAIHRGFFLCDFTGFGPMLNSGEMPAYALRSEPHRFGKKALALPIVDCGPRRTDHPAYIANSQQKQGRLRLFATFHDLSSSLLGAVCTALHNKKNRRTVLLSIARGCKHCATVTRTVAFRRGMPEFIGLKYFH